MKILKSSLVFASISLSLFLITTNHLAIVWTVRYRLNIVWHLGYKFINLEIDSQLVLGQFLMLSLHQILLFWFVIAGTWRTKIRISTNDLFREANSCAECGWLGKKGKRSSKQCNRIWQLSFYYYISFFFFFFFLLRTWWIRHPTQVPNECSSCIKLYSKKNFPFLTKILIKKKDLSI